MIHQSARRLNSIHQSARRLKSIHQKVDSRSSGRDPYCSKSLISWGITKSSSSGSGVTPMIQQQPAHIPSLSGAAKRNVTFSVLLTQIDQSDTIPHSAGLISEQPESGPSQSRPVRASRLLRRVSARESCCPGRPPAHSDRILGWPGRGMQGCG